jgi:hypothetical protein
LAAYACGIRPAFRAIGGIAADTPFTLAYVLAAVPGGCAHTACGL